VLVGFKVHVKLHTRFAKVVKNLLMLVAHTCNSGYSGGKDQEDHGQIVHETLHKNRAGGVTQGVGSEFKPQYHKKKKRKKEKEKKESLLLRDTKQN
jgi:hypothetical protein